VRHALRCRRQTAIAVPGSDYDVDTSGGSAAAHYISDYTKVAGIMVPTAHRIFPRQADGRALSDPLLVSTDISEIAFT
jgi:hypothetical protein